MKLHRLREARKMLIEKKKLSALDTSSEISSRTLRSEDSDKDVLFSREEVKSSSMPDLADNREEVDSSTEGIVQDLQVLPNLMDQSVESGEAPTTFHTAVNEEILQTEYAVMQN